MHTKKPRVESKLSIAAEKLANQVPQNLEAKRKEKKKKQVSEKLDGYNFKPAKNKSE